MSEQKTKQPAAKKDKPGVVQRVLGFLKRLPQTVAKPFRDSWHELRKVTWPTRQNLINSTLIVLVFMVFMGVVIGLLDMGSAKVVELLSGWAA